MHAAAHPPLPVAHSSMSVQVRPSPEKPGLHRHAAVLVIAQVAFGSHVRLAHVTGGGVSIPASGGGVVLSGSPGDPGCALKPHALSQSTMKARRTPMRAPAYQCCGAAIRISPRTVCRSVGSSTWGPLQVSVHSVELCDHEVRDG